MQRNGNTLKTRAVVVFDRGFSMLCVCSPTRQAVVDNDTSTGEGGDGKDELTPSTVRRRRLVTGRLSLSRNN